MGLKVQIEQDLKRAMLAGQKDQVTILRGIKSVILNAEITAHKRDYGLDENELVNLLQKEAKKRQESAELYKQGGNSERAEAELAEKRLIETYLPAPVSEAGIIRAVDKIMAETGAADIQAMGQVIGQVKRELGPSADGALVARIVKERLS